MLLARPQSGERIGWKPIGSRLLGGTGSQCYVVASEGGAHYILAMQSFTAIIERCSETGLFVGFVPGFPGAHSQGESMDELHRNLREVITMLLEDGAPPMEAEYVGTQQVTV